MFNRQISLDDRLPKMICENCCKKLEGIHKFATMAVKIQDKFNKIVTHSNLDNVLEPMNIENKGLLHTYLTKVFFFNVFHHFFFLFYSFACFVYPFLVCPSHILRLLDSFFSDALILLFWPPLFKLFIIRNGKNVLN